jgi:hypothetical protein
MKYGSIFTLGAAAMTLAAGARIGLASEQVSLPPLQHAGKVAYLSGGIGIDESTAIKHEMGKYSLVLEFAGHTGHGNDYLADIPVQITDANGKTILSTVSNGPFLLISLPDGHYSVTATYKGQPAKRSVNVRGGSSSRAVFVWTM